MYVDLKQTHRDGEHYVTPARAAAKETTSTLDVVGLHVGPPSKSNWNLDILNKCFCFRLEENHSTQRKTHGAR